MLNFSGKYSYHKFPDSKYSGCQRDLKLLGSHYLCLGLKPEILKLIKGKFTTYRKCSKYRIKASLHSDEPLCGFWPHYEQMSRFAPFGPNILQNGGPLCGLFRNLVSIQNFGITYPKNPVNKDASSIRDLSV